MKVIKSVLNRVKFLSMDYDEDVTTTAIRSVNELIQNSQSEVHSDCEDDKTAKKLFLNLFKMP